MRFDIQTDLTEMFLKAKNLLNILKTDFIQKMEC